MITDEISRALEEKLRMAVPHEGAELAESLVAFVSGVSERLNEYLEGDVSPAQRKLIIDQAPTEGELDDLWSSLQALENPADILDVSAGFVRNNLAILRQLRKAGVPLEEEIDQGMKLNKRLLEALNEK